MYTTEPNEKNMNAIIVCGGLSTRLGDITKDVPKVLLHVGNKTVLDWQIEKLKRAGVSRVVLAVGHLAHKIQESVGDMRQGVEIAYAFEPKKLGTGGAIKFALDRVEDKNNPTIILNGDILTGIDINDMISRIKSESDGIILGSYVEDVATYGTLVYTKEYHLQAFKEKEGIHKPGYQNGGCYIFNTSMKEYFPDQDTFSIEYDVLPHVKNLHVYESDRPWIDIGVPERLEWARDHWQEFLEES